MKIFIMWTLKRNFQATMQLKFFLCLYTFLLCRIYIFLTQDIDICKSPFRHFQARFFWLHLDRQTTFQISEHCLRYNMRLAINMLRSSWLDYVLHLIVKHDVYKAFNRKEWPTRLSITYYFSPVENIKIYFIILIEYISHGTIK